VSTRPHLSPPRTTGNGPTTQSVPAFEARSPGPRRTRQIWTQLTRLHRPVSKEAVGHPHPGRMSEAESTTRGGALHLPHHLSAPGLRALRSLALPLFSPSAPQSMPACRRAHSVSGLARLDQRAFDYRFHDSPPLVEVGAEAGGLQRVTPPRGPLGHTLRTMPTLRGNDCDLARPG
jgi:hypothetical protein